MVTICRALGMVPASGLHGDVHVLVHPPLRHRATPATWTGAEVQHVLDVRLLRFVLGALGHWVGSGHVQSPGVSKAQPSELYSPRLTMFADGPKRHTGGPR